METPKEFFDRKTLLTLAGASGAVVIVTGVLGHVFDFNPKWLALVIAELLALAAMLGMKDWPKKWHSCVPIALLNGCLIYSEAVGLNALNHGTDGEKAEPKHASLVPVIDPQPWWPPAEQKRAALELLDAANALLATNRALLDRQNDVATQVKQQRADLERRLASLAKDRSNVVWRIEMKRFEGTSMEALMKRRNDIGAEEGQVKTAYMQVQNVERVLPEVNAALGSLSQSSRAELERPAGRVTAAANRLKASYRENRFQKSK